MCKLKATHFSQVGAAQNPPWKSKRCRYPCVFLKHFFSILFAHTENVRGGGTKSHAARGYFYPDEIFEWIVLSFLVAGHEVF